MPASISYTKSKQERSPHRRQMHKHPYTPPLTGPNSAVERRKGATELTILVGVFQSATRRRGANRGMCQQAHYTATQAASICQQAQYTAAQAASWVQSQFGPPRHTTHYTKSLRHTCGQHRPPAAPARKNFLEKYRQNRFACDSTDKNSAPVYDTPERCHYERRAGEIL